MLMGVNRYCSTTSISTSCTPLLAAALQHGTKPGTTASRFHTPLWRPTTIPLSTFYTVFCPSTSQQSCSDSIS